MEVKNGISVLVSVYEKERVTFFKEAMESLFRQTRPADEIVIVEDGPLTEELYNYLDSIEKQYPNVIKRYALKENKGLGLALKYGVQQCQYDLIARMDTDDISVINRFELQEQCFLQYPNLDIVSGHIAEFISDPSEIVSYRKVPLDHASIAKYQKMRSALNHVCVMFKKSAVLAAGNYEHGLYMEDDLLWLNMIQSGAQLMNLDEVLCLVRVGEGMYERRGGTKYLKYYRKARKLMLKRKQISLYEYYLSIIIQLCVSLVPVRMRQFIFEKLLRESEE